MFIKGNVRHTLNVKLKRQVGGGNFLFVTESFNQFVQNSRFFQEQSKMILSESFKN